MSLTNLKYMVSLKGEARVSKIKKNFYEVKTLVDGVALKVKGKAELIGENLYFEVNSFNHPTFKRMVETGVGVFSGEINPVKITMKGGVVQHLSDDTIVQPDDEVAAPAETPEEPVKTEEVAEPEVVKPSESKPTETVGTKTNEEATTASEPEQTFQFVPVSEEVPPSSNDTNQEEESSWLGRIAKVATAAAAGYVIYRTVKYFSN